MVVKVYISGISGNKEVKKRQQRVLMILDSKNIKYEIIDITEPGREDDKDFMQNNAKCNGGTVSDPNPRSPLPPQLFNDLEYCGDYDQFDLANEVDTLEQFLKLELPPEEPPQTEKENAVNGDVSGGKVGKESKENSQERETVVSNETGEKEPSPTKETAPKAESPVREATPTKEEAVEDNTEQNEENNEAKAESPAKETTPEKEKSPQRQKSIDKEPSPVREDEEKAQNSHETDETVNGAVRSREQSEDIEVDEEQTGKSERKVDDPSIALIQSEAAAAAE
ncbi:PREDICTED: SH3 domain-binding glutamic acid-rich protein homolog isoform X1 [Papilio polytes]|uniref:SH3 domain-binding glutamic acid-rich protein homolog isoform X1 n=2 Tax=Papilio polytes TaxID=76194 RepID=UPI000675EFE8|nr:PREDICTED: SH3 domain-binding glutamic acid-rich protein homolog isoform X1 [Papilio polytes]